RRRRTHRVREGRRSHRSRRARRRGEPRRQCGLQLAGRARSRRCEEDGRRLPRRHGRRDRRRAALSRPTWSRSQRRKNEVIYAAANAALAVGLTVPRSWLPWLGSAIGSLSLVLFREARRTTLRNLELVHPELGPAARSALAGEIFRTLGRNLTNT